MAVATTTVGLTDLKFRLVREDFADAVAWVARNLPTRPTVPVLAGVLLTGSDDGLTISGFDYEVSAEVQVAAEIASPGSVLVSGRLLSDITRALPAKPVDVSVEGTRVVIDLRQRAGSPCRPWLSRIIRRCRPCPRRPGCCPQICSPRPSARSPLPRAGTTRCPC